MLLNPNCSETYYKLSKKDLEKLSKDTLKKLEKASQKPTEGYSTLRAEKEDDICFYFYQHSAPWLEKALLAAGIKYLVEKPFIDDIETPREYFFGSDEEWEIHIKNAKQIQPLKKKLGDRR